MTRCHRLDIVGRDRIFQPHRFHVFEGVGQVDDIAHIVAPVGFDGEVDIRPELFANRFHCCHDAADVFGGEVAGVRVVTGLRVAGIGTGRNAVALELEGRPAPLLGARRGHVILPGLHVFHMRCGLRHGAVEANLIAEAAAQQIADGRLENSARQIPKRDLDAAGGRHRHPGDGARAGAAHQHFGVELVDIQRIFADDVLFELIEHQIFHAGSPVGLADSVKAGLIGLDFDQIPVPCAAHDHALHVGDLHLVFLCGGGFPVRAGKEESRQRPENPGDSNLCLALHELYR